MSVQPGTRLGVYEITAALGAGGMGEVYRARDTKLDRDVAIKILPELFASDPERLARFEREAKTLASLNHPNIAHIHGIEDSASGRALVMELVEGDDLAVRLARGPLPVTDAILIARQIAEALDAAHERGIIHRDLKPANIKVTDDGTVKVLDFGLAKAMEPGSASAADAMNSPTFASPATQLGVILGTAAYMAPEQAKGKAVDKRADIWAFGAVLFEMLTGRAPFNGDSTTEVLGAVVLREPDWTALPPATPLRVRELLRRCLEKDSKRRLRDIGDARFDLGDAHDTPSVAPALAATSLLRTAGLVAAGALVAAAATWLALRAPAPQPAKRFAVSGLAPLVFDAYQTLTLSPDGRALAFRGRGSDGVDRLFVRDFDTLQLKPVAGSDGGRMPFFSADGQWLGFFAGGFLRKVPVMGGTPQTIAPANASTAAGGTWMDDGSIVFVGGMPAGVERVSSSGGTPETLLTLDPKSGPTTPASPWALPGSDGVLLMVRQGNRFDVAVLSLRDRKLHVLAEDAYSPAWVPTGHVLFHQGDAILALPFDTRSLRATGSAFPVASGVGNRISYQTRLFAVARDGTFVYVPAASAAEGGWAMMWVDRKGRETAAVTLERPSDTPRLSPDGTRVAFRTPAPNCDVWVHDLTRGTTMRLTREGDNHGVVWRSDGARVMVSRVTSTGTDILALPADGGSTNERMGSFSGESGATPTSWSSSVGVLLVQDRFTQSTGMDIVAVPAGGGESKPFLNEPFDESEAVISPDGHLVAYVSNETGRTEIYVRPVSGKGPRLQVSTTGGTEPVWSPAGGELFFRNGRDVLAVGIRDVPAFSIGRPQVLFSGDYPYGPVLANYDVSRDGKRFLMMRGRQWIEGQVVVVMNWFSDWKQLGSGAKGQ